MHTPLPRFFKHRVFFVYWALILALGGYLAYDYCTDYYAELEPVLKNTVVQGVASAERLNEYRLMEIHKIADAYKMEHNEQLRRKAKAAMDQVQVCQNRLGTLKRTPESIRAEDIEQLADLLEQLGDSLFLFVDQDPILEADLQVLILQHAAALKTPKMQAFFRHVPASKVALYLEDLAWKSVLALNLVLDYLQKQITPDEMVLKMIPVFEPTGCPRVGQAFTGRVDLVAYATNPDSMALFVNEKKYPVRNGIAEFQQVYPRPGRHTDKVKILLTNPLTGQIASYSYEIELNILKP
ncbi:MAG: hypothetical protein IPM36_07000 [Lewinellaceae bacterium]|nr:hypothetical protein [Lewinellaceae bacterium]